MKELIESGTGEFYTNKFSSPNATGGEEPDRIPDETPHAKGEVFDYVIPEEADNGKTLLTNTDKFNSAFHINATINTATINQATQNFKGSMQSTDVFNLCK